MTVRLDLRPVKIDVPAERVAKRAGVVCAVSFCFFAVSAALFLAEAGTAFYRTGSFKDFASINGEYKTRLSSADAELKQLRAESGNAARRVEFILGGLPALQFLDGAAACLTDGLAIESVEMSRGSALVKGAALSDEAVLSFAKALSRSPSVEKVGVPAVASAQLCSAEIKTFSLDVKLRDLKGSILSPRSILPERGVFV